MQDSPLSVFSKWTLISGRDLDQSLAHSLGIRPAQTLYIPIGASLIIHHCPNPFLEPKISSRPSLEVFGLEGYNLLFSSEQRLLLCFVFFSQMSL